MKTFLLAVLVVIILSVIGFFAFKYIQNLAQVAQPSGSPVQTLVGVLQPIQFNGQYSDVIINGTKTVGVTSSHLDLKPYENKKVEVTGEYSGNTMYADTVVITP